MLGLGDAPEKVAAAWAGAAKLTEAGKSVGLGPGGVLVDWVEFCRLCSSQPLEGEIRPEVRPSSGSGAELTPLFFEFARRERDRRAREA